MKNKRARVPDEVRAGREREKERREGERTTRGVPIGPLDPARSPFLQSPPSGALAHTTPLLSLLPPVRPLRLPRPRLGRQAQDQHDGERRERGIPSIHLSSDSALPPNSHPPFPFSFPQVSAKDHARFIESYGTILKAHMDGLKKKEKVKKKK